MINYNIFAKSQYHPEYRVIQAGMENKLSKSTIIKLLNAGDEMKMKNIGNSTLQATFQLLSLIRPT